MLKWLIGRSDEDEVRLPVLRKNYESTVAGLHIVGDLAGAPTIRVAANQGHDVMKHIAALPDGRAGERTDLHDVVIVGGGSSGIAAALEAKHYDVHVIVLDAGRLANTIREFPKGKEIYAEPKAVPNRSHLFIEDCVKEELLERWDAQLATCDLNVREGVTVTDIRRKKGPRKSKFAGQRALMRLSAVRQGARASQPPRVGEPEQRSRAGCSSPRIPKLFLRGP